MNEWAIKPSPRIVGLDKIMSAKDTGPLLAHRKYLTHGWRTGR
jgi:hypothetical protein